MSELNQETEDSCPEQTASGRRPSGLPPCCHSGCTVCVLDYPELFMNAEVSGDEMEMLKAIEEALARVEAET
ncbi:MAG TPA: hypothetical protein VFD58_37225 [Blastocatellia bacterium]|nr:hypothetical protein [Blastocatellia bacterium]